jgi:hypothetical protein
MRLLMPQVAASAALFATPAYMGALFGNTHIYRFIE